jgi:hypothetical protein
VHKRVKCLGTSQKTEQPCAFCHGKIPSDTWCAISVPNPHLRTVPARYWRGAANPPVQRVPERRWSAEDGWAVAFDCVPQQYEPQPTVHHASAGIAPSLE